MTERAGRIREHLLALYGPAGRLAHEKLEARLARYRGRLPAARPGPGLSQRDAMLITYADQILAPGEAPLAVLADFARRHLAGLTSIIHLLPFYPWSSDDGFSVRDYRAVDPALGTWADVARLAQDFRLMFDAVINHASAQCEWFQAFLRAEPQFRDFFVTVEGEPDLSQVVRPRALPLLTRFETAAGPQAIWTTFSADQVDLNFHNPDVLVEIVDVLLFYVAQGAEFLRLDAIAYLWKEIGTPCIHLPQTHHVIQLLRLVLDEVAPHVQLITETNVPHADNISYFGDGTNEAQLVYNFALPPLVLHTFRTGEAEALARWASQLALPGGRVCFFNFLASHDGVGVNPARGLLPPEAIEALVARVLAHGGRVSYKHNPDGSQSPYELNINYFDALSNPQGGEPLAVQVARFMAAQAIMLALAGLPGIYAHSLLGSRGWPEGVRQTGHNRTINRQKLEREGVEAELADPGSLRHAVFTRYAALLRARAASAAFDPFGPQQVLPAPGAVFALLRTAPDGSERVLCLHNVTAEPQVVQLQVPGLARAPRPTDWLAGREMCEPGDAPGAFTLAPYGVAWLRVDG